MSTQQKTASGLDALWQRHRSAWGRLLSLRMFTELKLRAIFDVRPVSLWRVRNTVPKGTIPDCASCPDICCAGLENVVSLRLRDIAMLIDIGRTDLISREKPNFPSYMLRERPALFELVGSELWRTLPVLKQVGEDRICAALSPDYTCTLHPHWPTSCERFPYALAAGGRKVFWGRRCPSKQQDADFVPRAKEMVRGAIDAYNERIRDAVLLAHARRDLEKLGITEWLTDPYGNPFEPRQANMSFIE